MLPPLLRARGVSPPSALVDFGLVILPVSVLRLVVLPVSVGQAAASQLPVVAGCEAGNAGRSLAVPVQPNTEVPEAVSIGAFGAEGFSISIDNRTVAGAPAPSVSQRTNDLRNDSASTFPPCAPTPG